MLTNHPPHRNRHCLPRQTNRPPQRLHPRLRNQDPRRARRALQRHGGDLEDEEEDEDEDGEDEEEDEASETSTTGESAHGQPQVAARPRLRDGSPEELARRRRRREAIVLHEGDRPLTQEDIIQRRRTE